MIKYETLPTFNLKEAELRSSSLPELVHLDDPAFSVMTDFNQIAPYTINMEETMDDALNEMKVVGVHQLLVIDTDHKIQGVIGSEDILGEKPIQLIQQRRIDRAQVLVKMIMAPLKEITAIDIDSIEHARVGNIVNTLTTLRQHYALVIQKDEKTDAQLIRGIFTASQISKQLHTNISNTITKAQSLSELQKRHED